MRIAKAKAMVLIPLSGAWILGCTAKPKPDAVKDPATPEVAVEAPVSDANASDGEARRQRMLQLAREAFQPIYFPYDQAILDDHAKRVLADIRAFMREYPDISVSVEGHADERGTDDYNLALGDRRSNAVYAYLANLGVPKTNLKAISFGEERPAREGHTEADWKMNRRVEFAPSL